MGIFNHELAEIWFDIVGEGHPVLMLHGFELDHHSLFNSIEPVIIRENIHLKRVYIDLPGMGMSIAKPGLVNADDMLRVIKDFCLTLFQNEWFSIIGLSYGAYIGRALWLDHKLPVQNAFWICPVIKPKTIERMLPSFKIARKDKDFVKIISEEEYLSIKDWMVVQTKEVYEAFNFEIKPALQKGQKDFLERFVKKGYCLKKDINHTISNRKCTFLCGKSDTTVGYLDAVNVIGRYENADLILLSGAGHYLQREREEFFNDYLIHWLTSL